ncbi:MAG TPA: hypothetical protein VLL54_02460 [Pyrinomonadaceae bacterium]|nr:hypothetical protein [Pyrinomonadaceae bacterium]
MNTDKATLTVFTAGNMLIASLNISHPSGPDDFVTPTVLTTDRTSLANRIMQVKNAMPASATNIWAALQDPLAAPAAAGVAARFEECMDHTIGEGSSLYRDLANVGMASMLKQLDQMPEGSSLTINTDSAFLPWEILYSRAFDANWPQSVKDQNPPADPKRLWGYRFLINYNLLDQAGTSDWAELMAAHKNGGPFISLNLNATIANPGKPFQPIQHHRDFYTQQLLQKNIGQVYDLPANIEDQLYSTSQNATVLYLYCHGRNSVPFAADNSEALELAPDKQVKPTALGSATNVYARAPIVFLNSCTSGQPSPLSFSSFFKVFRQKQAMGMIGTSIEMPATFGAAFGCRLLTDYLNGVPLGVAIYDLRRELIDKGNPLGLFYSLQCPADLTAPTPAS